MHAQMSEFLDDMKNGGPIGGRHGSNSRFPCLSLFLPFSATSPQPDSALKNAARIKIRHYRQLYAERPDPIVFLPVTVSTSGRVYDDFALLIF